MEIHRLRGKEARSAKRGRVLSPSLCASGFLPGCVGAASQGFHKGFDKEMVAPGDRLVHSQALVIMIEAVQQDAFPFRPGTRQKIVGAKRLQYQKGAVPIPVTFFGRRRLLRQIEKPAGGDGGGGAVPKLRRV